jgi:hypothetical protein
VELIPFSERALRHFLFPERPEGVVLEDSVGAEGLREALAHAQPAMSPREIVPRGQQFAAARPGGISRLSLEGAGEDHRPRSAKAALELIMEQGEGAHGDWRAAHFGRFLEVLHEYLAMREADPDFEHQSGSAGA